LLVERQGVDRDVAVRVTKSIPIAAGLGGGSSDAAAFLRLAQQHWSLPRRVVYEVAREIGSDVALFLTGGAVLMEGRGERVTLLPDAATDSPDWGALIYTPELPLPSSKTAAMYGALRPTHLRGDDHTVELGAALVRGSAPAQDDCWNTFDLMAGEVLMGLTDARRRVAAATQQVAVLAGAGPSLFLLGDPDALEPAVEQLNAEGSGRARLVRPLSREAATRIELGPDDAASAGGV
jgi:4-diphosphocytidyl-2-C-methyl-D-erythritol kinase